MTIHLSKELERFVEDAVRAGLYAREDDVIRDALVRLRQTMPGDAAVRGTGTKRTKPTLRGKKPLTMTSHWDWTGVSTVAVSC